MCFYFIKKICFDNFAYVVYILPLNDLLESNNKLVIYKTAIFNKKKKKKNVSGTRL